MRNSHHLAKVMAVEDHHRVIHHKADKAGMVRLRHQDTKCRTIRRFKAADSYKFRTYDLRKTYEMTLPLLSVIPDWRAGWLAG